MNETFLKKFIFLFSCSNGVWGSFLCCVTIGSRAIIGVSSVFQNFKIFQFSLVKSVLKNQNEYF
jgi:hypothetical protein